MKLNQWLLIIAIGIFTACQNNQSTQKEEDTTIALTTQQSCYTYINNKDKASLVIMISGYVVTGELNYQLFEKDSNQGAIKGEMRGDTLVADYIFNSEGKQSTRQVAFLKKDGKLIEGFGNAIEKDGKMVFKDLSKLTFNSGIEFVKTDCK